MKPTEWIETNTCKFRLDEAGILRMNINPGARVDDDEVRRVFGIIQKITGGRKVLELMEGGDFYTFDRKAQKYAATHGRNLFIASALITKSRAMRVLFNFFNSFFSHPVPFKMFASEAPALRWLKTHGAAQ